MKDAITYANEAGFFSFNVVGWKAEFERLIEAVRADALAELVTVKESLTAQDHSAGTGNKVSDHIADAGTLMLTTEQAQQIEEALDELRYANNTDIAKTKYYKALSTIRAARANFQSETSIENNPADSFKANYPVAWKCLCGANLYIDSDGSPASKAEQAEQTNTQLMEGYRIGLAEMREKCAKVVTEHAPTCSPHWVSYVVAIRAINFEGDTGFRPVSEMIAEHKQDPKKAAAIEKAKMRKAEQEPVAFRFPRDTESWTGGWTIDYKVIRSVDAEIEDNEFKPCLESVEQVLLALEKVYAAPQPVKQEPVAKLTSFHGGKITFLNENQEYLRQGTLFYAAQQPVQDIMEAVDAAMAEMQNINPPLRRSECERLIRAANYAAPVQEPIGYVIEDDSGYTGSMIYANKGGDCFLPVYLTSPVRTKDLTEQEIQDAIINISPTGTGYFLRIARAVIAADREKNRG